MSDKVAPATEDFEHFRTNDMAMATFLRMQGHAVQEIFWETGTCYWRFVVTGQLLKDMSDFQDGRALVDPRTYNRMFAITKQELYRSEQTFYKGDQNKRG